MTCRIALLVEYVGKKFSGSQYQLNERTVQSDLESTLSTFLRQQTRVTLSGRTDSGVHAVGQVAHFDISASDTCVSSAPYPLADRTAHSPRLLAQSSASDQEITEDYLWRLVWGMNGILGEDISVRAAQVVPADFHARFTATSRQYVYRILNASQRSPILKDTYYFLPDPLNWQKMAEAANFLVGTHDFGSFRSTNSDTGTSYCEVSQSQLLNLGEGRLEFWIAANHFVYNMVRIIMGTLIEVGLGERTPESLLEALQRSDRNLAGPTAPARGLTLASVKYPESLCLFAEDKKEESAQCAHTAQN